MPASKTPDSNLQYHPTPSETLRARSVIDPLSRHAGEDLKVRIPGEKDVTLPATSVRLLVDILTQMAAGHSVTLMSEDKYVTTQQAADFLGVSRPFVTRLLKEGAIAFTTVGTHRRIRFKDLVSYKQTMESESYKAMAELAKQAQELGMGY
jgi:excisionase family DNA binding protein